MQTNASSIALFDADKVLLVERAGPPFAGLWTLPGGRMEVGETPEACVKRELWEETSLVVTDPLEVLVEEITSAGTTFRLTVFAAAHPQTAPLISEEIADWDWVKIQEIPGYRTTRGLDRIVRRCAERLQMFSPGS